MKIAELIISGIALVGLIMNLFLMPGGGFLLVISLSTLSIFYFALSFALLDAEALGKRPIGREQPKIETFRVVGALLTGIGLSIAVIGILFKIMHWSGEKMMLLVGATELGIISVVAAYKFMATKTAFYRGILMRASIVGILALLLYLLPKYALTEFKYRHYPNYVNAVKKFDEDPDNKVLLRNVQEEREMMNRSK